MIHRNIVAVCLLFLAAFSTVWAVTSQVRIQKVWPEKLVSRQNTDAVITVTLANFSDTDQPARMICELVTGIGKTEKIFDGEVKVPAGDLLNVPIRFNTGNLEWGVSARAKILDSRGTVVSEADNVFGITNNFYKLAVCYSFLHSSQSIGATELRNIAYQRRNAYWPVTEWFGGFHSWALNQWGLEKEQWLANGAYPESKTALKAFVDAAHKEGTGVVIYDIPALCGPAGADYAREHPDWLAYTNGRPTYVYLDVEAMDKLQDPNITPQEADKIYIGVMTYTPLLFTDPAVMDNGADQIIQVSKYYGFDGIRWDGYPMLMSIATVAGIPDYNGACNYKGESMMAGIKDIDQWNENSINRMNNRIRKQLPDFIFGDNWSPEYADIIWPEKIPKTFRTAVKDALVIDEDLTQAVSQGGLSSPLNLKLWDIYRRHIVRGADHMRAAGGHECVSEISPGTPVYNRQMLSIIYAGGSCIGITYPETQWFESADYFRFALRYSEILYSSLITRILDPDKIPILQVQSEKPLWWKEYVYQGILTDGKKYLLVNMVNPPVKPNLDYNEKQPPAEQVNIVVAVDERLAGKVARAYLLSPDIPGNNIELAVVHQSGAAKVVVPSLKYWNMVVFEIGG